MEQQLLNRQEFDNCQRQRTGGSDDTAACDLVVSVAPHLHVPQYSRIGDILKPSCGKINREAAGK